MQSVGCPFLVDCARACWDKKVASGEEMTVEVHETRLIPKELLSEHPRNSNKQNRHIFKELRKSIRENGFDESLIVTPRDDDAGYWIVSGNHRFRAGVAEGVEEFPCVIRDDWDAAKEQVEMVRRNYVRGKLDRDTFTVAVDALAEDHAMSVDSIRDEMGFEDPDIFLQVYKQEAQVRTPPERTAGTQAPRVKMVDDMGMVLSGIFEMCGDTVDKSFIVFPAGGRKHMYIAATPAIIRVMSQLAEYSIANHMDLNLVLGGVLVLGKNQANLNTPEADKDAVVAAGSSTDGPKEFA